MRSIVSFFLGLMIGAAGGAYVAKTISDKKAEDAIEKATLEARDYYKEKYAPKEEPKPEPTIENFSRIHGRAFDIRPTEPKHSTDVETYAYELDDPDDFGEDGYSTYFLTYYSDGNLVDETNNVVDDPIHLVGGDVLDKLDDKNPITYVRNDITKTDYEITYVDDTYEQSGGVKD